MSAKKKKQSAKRKPAKKEDLASPNYFWRQVWIFVFIVFALFLLIGGFGWGGVLPVKLFSGASWLFGLVAFLVPFVIIFLAIQKYKHEEFLIPFAKLFASFLFLVCVAGMVHVFVDRSESALAASKGTYGGEIGHLASSGLLMFLNSTTAFILFFVFAWLAFMMMFGIAPKKMIAHPT